MTGLEAIPLVIAAASAATTAAAAAQANKAAKKSLASAAKANVIETKQVKQQASLERKKRELESIQRIGRLRAIAGDTGSASTLGFLQTAEEYTNAFDQYVIGTNEANRINALGSQFSATGARINATRQNIALSTVQGGLSGFGQGLQIQSGIRGLLGPTTPPVVDVPSTAIPYVGDGPNYPGVYA